jgi:HlyD family secretion protein
MKRTLVVVAALAVIGALGVGWWWSRTSPERATGLLVLAGIDMDRAGDLASWLGGKLVSKEDTALVASGTIEAEEVTIAPELGGRIVWLGVAEGDRVEAGQVLVRLDSSQLLAELAKAKSAVAAAQANLESVKAGTHPAQILAAEAELALAQARRDAAWAAWQDAETLARNPEEIEGQIVLAEGRLGLATAQIPQAEARVALAEVERDRYRAQGSMEEKWLFQVHAYQVEAARAALDAALAEKAGAEQSLTALRAIRDKPLILTGQARRAGAEYRVAVAGVEVGEARLRELRAGPTPEGVRAAEAQVMRAEAAVLILETQLDKMTLRSPISGLVSSAPAHVGEAILAGARPVTVASLDEVELRVYLAANELGRVHLGQEIGVTVDSFPGRVFRGSVSHIAQQAEFTPRSVQTAEERVNVVFAVTVRLSNPEHLLRPGMPADATLD